MTTSAEHTLSVASVNMILFAIRQRGLDSDDLARSVGIDPVQLRDPDGRLPIRTMQDLWREIIARTGDPSIALRIGEMINPMAFGVLAYVMMHSPTLGRAFEKLFQYQDIVCDGIRTSGQQIGSQYVISLHLTSREIIYPDYAVNSELSVYLSAMHALTGQHIPVSEVRFSYPRPADTTEHERVFAPARLTFGAPETSMVLDAALLDTPVMNASASLFPLVEQHAIDQMKRLQTPTPTLAQRVRTEIVSLMRGEEPALTVVADRLAMGVRTLQLHLKEEGTTYQQLLTDVRRDLAVKHLREPNFSTTDIAYLLGFAEPSVFFRSFKKWTGQTPGAFRATAFPNSYA
ncbi:AraC family transcriptional regulator [Spirosoma arcticum]